MKRTYLRAVLGFAFQRTVTRTDTTSLLVGVVVPALLAVTGRTVADLTALIAWCVISVVGVVALVRLLTAPYFVWLEQSARIAALEAELARPEQRAKELIHEGLTHQRFELAGVIGAVKIAYQRGLGAEEIAERMNRANVLSEMFLHDHEYKRRWGEFTRSLLNYVIETMKRQAEMSNVPEAEKMAVAARQVILPHPGQAELERTAQSLTSYLLGRT